jgi:hypothetical protein
MSFIKKIVKYFLAIAVIFLAGFFLIQKTDVVDQKYYQKIFPCDKPFRYSIGSIDQRFGISRADFVKIAEDSEGVWEKALGRNLFQYDPQSNFKINLIYDERQLKSDEARKLEENLGQLDSLHDSVIRKYSSLSSAYKKRIGDYDASVAGYEKDLEQYNKDVSFWNDKGGAPKDEFDKLKKRKNDLSDTFSELEKERIAINQLVGKTNDLVAEENKIVNIYNNNLATYKNRFGGSREFEKGVFDGKEINIYQFNEKADLRLTLIHELGHALGISHVENPQSLMYYLMSDQNMDSPKLSSEDIQALKDVCRIK